MRAVIVGAGIGGLVTALRLHRAGIACAVYEQSERSARWASGSTCLPHAVRVLAESGLLDALDAVAVRTPELVYAHRLGPEILHRPCGIDAGYALPQLSIHRGRLQGVLLHAVRNGSAPAPCAPGVGWSASPRTAPGVRARFDRRGRLETVADVLVGADGIHSTARRLLFPTEGPPRWNGVQMWRGATEWHAVRDRPFDDRRRRARPPSWWSTRSGPGTRPTPPAHQLGGVHQDRARRRSAARDARTGRAAPTAAEWPATSPVSGCRAWTTSALVRCDSGVLRVPDVRPRPAAALEPGRVTLLGDAAHPMYPMGSNGAGQAVLDAESLADALAQRRTRCGRCAAYEGPSGCRHPDVVLRNRVGGPESVIDEVERRAPTGYPAGRRDRPRRAAGGSTPMPTPPEPTVNSSIASPQEANSPLPRLRNDPTCRPVDPIAVEGAFGGLVAPPTRAANGTARSKHPRRQRGERRHPNPRCTSRTVTSQDRDEIGPVVRSYRVTIELDQSSGTSCPRTPARSDPDWDQRGDA